MQAKAGGAVTATDQQLVCEPALVGVATVSFVDRKSGLNESNDVAVMLPLDPGSTVVDWRDSEPVDIQERDLATQPPAGAVFAGRRSGRHLCGPRV